MHSEDNFNQRENFLIAVINKLIEEYKSLRDSLQRKKLFKIVSINKISPIPGETEFTIQIINKNCALQVTAENLICDYNLTDFSNYHAELIRQAAQGKLIQFLKLTDSESLYKIISKKLDRKSGQYIFTLENKEKQCFIRTAEEIVNEKNILINLNWIDIYDLGYTQGMESILKEKSALALTKNI